MKLSKYESNAGRARLCIASVAALGLLVAISACAKAATAPVSLGTASSFVVLAGSGIATQFSTLTGNIGTFPTPSITGLSTSFFHGINHGADEETREAKKDLATAYTTAAGAGPTTTIPAELGGKTLKPGVFSASALILGQFDHPGSVETGEKKILTLDGGGNPNAVFIFKSASTLDAVKGVVMLTNGASPCNVFWQVSGSATLLGSRFVGTIMSLKDIHLKSDTGHGMPADDSFTVVDGRALAINGTVTLQGVTIRRPTCQATPTPTAQVSQVPKGAVRTGDGSTSGGGNDLPGLLAGALVLAGVGGATVVASRQRRRVNA